MTTADTTHDTHAEDDERDAELVGYAAIATGLATGGGLAWLTVGPGGWNPILAGIVAVALGFVAFIIASCAGVYVLSTMERPTPAPQPQAFPAETLAEPEPEPVMAAPPVSDTVDMPLPTPTESEDARDLGNDDDLFPDDLFKA